MRGITGVDLFGTTDAVVKHVLEVCLFTAIAGYGLFSTETVTVCHSCVHSFNKGVCSAY